MMFQMPHDSQSPLVKNMLPSSKLSKLKKSPFSNENSAQRSALKEDEDDSLKKKLHG
jgi:hypothetical protein